MISLGYVALALWLSPHLLTNTARVLKAAGVNDAEIEEYVAVRRAESS